MVRKKTDQKVRQIENGAMAVRRNATSKASFIAAQAEAEASFLVRELASFLCFCKDEILEANGSRATEFPTGCVD